MQCPTDLFSEYETQLVGDPMPPELKKSERIDFRAIFAGAIFAGGLLWAAHGEISKLDDRLVSLDKHISRVETAVRIIGAKQGGDTKTLVDEALTVANNAARAGHAENAKAILAYANRLLDEQRQSKTEVPQQFFETALTNYQSLKASPELRESARAGTLALAEYKSAIMPKPPETQGRQTTNIGEYRQIGRFKYFKDSYFVGKRALVTSSEGTDIDYTILENVVFENAVIIYKGGPVVFKNVSFVNCKFMVPDSPNGDQVLVAAIQQPATARIG